MAMKRPILLAISFALLFCIGTSQKIPTLEAANNNDTDSRYVMFIGEGTVGDPIVTWQKIGDQVKKPNIFKESILNDETLPLVIIAAETAGGQLPPGVERLIRSYRLKNGEDPSVILLNKESINKIDAGLKAQLKELGLVFVNNKIEVESPALYQKTSFKTRFCNRLKDAPTMATMLIKASIQAVACYVTVRFTGIGDLSQLHILAFVGMNMAITIGINSFIEEYIKVRNLSAQLVNKGIDKTFDKLTEVFDALKSMRDYIGDLTETNSQRRLLRATMARLATDNKISDPRFTDYMKKTTKFVIRGDLAFQTLFVAVPLTFASWAIGGVSGEVFDFANSLGIEGHSLLTIMGAGAALIIANSISLIPLDVANAYMNRVGVFSTKMSIWLSPILDTFGQKDKLGQTGYVESNNLFNRLFAYVSLPIYLFSYWAAPATKMQDVKLEQSKDELNEVINDINTVFEAQPNLTDEILAQKNLQNRERRKLGIGFVDNLLAKPDLQLLLDLTYLLQKYMDDGTFKKLSDINPKFGKKFNQERLEGLLANLQYLRDAYAEVGANAELTKEDFATITKVANEAEVAVSKARDFNKVKPMFWKECGKNLKKALMSIGWIKKPTDEEIQKESAKKIEEKYQSKVMNDDLDNLVFSKKDIETFLDLAFSAENIFEARDYLTKANTFVDYLPEGSNDVNLLKAKIKEVGDIITESLKQDLINKIDKSFNQNNSSLEYIKKTYPRMSLDDAKIVFALEYATNMLDGALTSDYVTSIILGDIEDNFENGIIFQASKIKNTTSDPYLSVLIESRLKKLRMLILGNNKFVYREGKTIDIVEFFGSIYTAGFTKIFLGSDGSIEKLTPEDFRIPVEDIKLEKYNIDGLERLNKILEITSRR